MVAKYYQKDNSTSWERKNETGRYSQNFHRNKANSLSFKQKFILTQKRKEWPQDKIL